MKEKEEEEEISVKNPLQLEVGSFLSDTDKDSVDFNQAVLPQEKKIKIPLRRGWDVPIEPKGNPQEVVDRIAKLIETNYHLFEGWNDCFDSILDLLLSTLERDDKRYLEVAKKLDSKALNIVSQIFGELLTNFCYNYLIYDYLGQVYMRVGFFSKSKYFGQYFTPFNVSRLIAQMQVTDVRASIEVAKREGRKITVCDPAVGSGSLLLAMKEHIAQEVGLCGLDYFEFYGQDIDRVCVKMAKIQMIFTNYRYMTSLLLSTASDIIRSSYCFDYVSRHQIKFEKKALSIFQKEKENLNDSFKKEFTELKKVKAKKLDQNIATPEFDRKKFTVLLFLELEIFSDNFKNLIPNSENFLSDLEEKWLDLLEIFKDFCNRVFNGRGYITAEKSFTSLQCEIASDYAYRTERLEQAHKSIVHYNQLVKELFSGKEGKMGVDFSQIQKGTHLYFVTSKSKSNFNFRQSSDYFNVGRIKKKEDNKWEDIHLSLVDSYRTYDFSTTQEALENPIYKVKEVKSNEVVLIDTASKETVKILASRKYAPQIIYFHHQYRPQVKAYKKTHLKEFF
jgi:hypothetical protein